MGRGGWGWEREWGCEEREHATYDENWNRGRDTINKEPPHGLNQCAQKLLRNL